MPGQGVRTEVEALARRFATATPFRNMVIDNFLDAFFARRLLAKFAAFVPARAVNEDGRVGNKAVHESVRALGLTYAALDDMVQGRGFLGLLSRITGIRSRMRIVGST